MMTIWERNKKCPSVLNSFLNKSRIDLINIQDYYYLASTLTSKYLLIRIKWEDEIICP